MRRFCVLVNPFAGNGRALHIIKPLEEELKKLPVEFRTVVTKDVAHAQEEATHAIEQSEYIAIVGGDGSIRAIAGIVTKMKGVMAIIPAGRGNDDVRTLHVPLDPIEACKVLAFGTETSVDIAEVNHQPFLGICTLGFDSIANQIANQTRIIRGRAVYVYGGLRALITWKPIHFKVTIDGNTFEHIGYTVAVANAQIYGGGMQLAPDASMQDGLLDVVLIGQIPKLRMLVNVPRIFKGTHTKEPGFEIRRGRHIKIEADPKFKIFADGDPIGEPPAEIQILPKALSILIPS